MLNESIRSDMNIVEISQSTIDFFFSIFGRSTKYSRGKYSQKEWKKILNRNSSILKKSVDKNINSDGFHKWRVDLYLEQLQDACKSKHNVDPEIIVLLTSIIFELLGGVPNYRGRYRLNKKDDFKLNQLRSLDYRQSPYQKFCTIIEASRYKPYCDYHKYEDLYQKYIYEYNGDPVGFIKWYKTKYPEAYANIF
jgi:hypothetical protein